jgi:low density lipoprotein-related protein 2
VILSDKLMRPAGLTVDLPPKRLYFADNDLNFIDFCNYDGSGRTTVIDGSHVGSYIAIL